MPCTVLLSCEVLQPWCLFDVLAIVYEVLLSRKLTLSSRTSVVEPGFWVLSIETANFNGPVDVRMMARSSALPSSGMAEPDTDASSLKLNSAGTPSHAATTVSAYHESDDG